MYKRIVLAFDGSLEGRAALREGALLAKCCGAQVFLLSVVADSPGLRVAEGAQGGAVTSAIDKYRPILEAGLTRLKDLGFSPKGALVMGEPAQQIGAYAKEVEADLVIVGHRKQGFLERWWSGSTGAYLMEHITCSLLISRNVWTDEAFAAEFQALSESQS